MGHLRDCEGCYTQQKQSIKENEGHDPSSAIPTIPGSGRCLMHSQDGD